MHEAGEAHFEMKIVKALQVRAVEKVHAAVAGLLREAHFEVKMVKTHQVRTLLEVEMLKSACACGAKHVSK